MNDVEKTFETIDKAVNKAFPKNPLKIPPETDIIFEWLPLSYTLLSVLSKKENKNTFTKNILIIVTAPIILNIMVQLLKKNVKRRRPGSLLKYNSFPSRHTATSFCGADILYRSNTSNNYEALAAYTIATGTAALRLTRKKHWFSDILAGAVIGIISANIAHLIFKRI